MGYQIYEVGGNRWGGYGVPATCEHPDCKAKIDRGMSYACGGEPFSEVGCDRYFCSKHLSYVGFKRDGSDERCDCEEDCKCEVHQVCERCEAGADPFPYKEERSLWLRHILTHGSWKKWREKNPAEVEEYQKQYEKHKRKKQ